MWLQNYFEKTDTQYKVTRALMELWAECFGPHLILSVWGQCVSLGDHIPDVSQRISVRQAERAPEGDVGRNVEELRRPGHEGMGLG